MTKTWVMRASSYAEPGACHAHALGPDIVAGMSCGWQRGSKLTANEDSLSVVTRDGALACVVADSHFGPWAGEVVAEVFAERASRSVDVASLLCDCEAAIAERRSPHDDSETTALALSVREGTLRWASVGDSALWVCRATGERLTPAPSSSVYLGATSRPHATMARLPEGAVSSGVVTLAPGDLVLVATDGIEPDACGLSAAQVVAALREEGTLLRRVERLLERAGSRFSGGGDNLALVVISPT